MKEIEFIKSQVETITSSKLWRFYSFLSKIKRKILGKDDQQFFFKEILINTANVIYSNPRLKSLAKSSLRRFPNLENKLKKLYFTSYVSLSINNYDETIQEFSKVIDEISTNAKSKNGYNAPYKELL